MDELFGEILGEILIILLRIIIHLLMQTILWLLWQMVTRYLGVTRTYALIYVPLALVVSWLTHLAIAAHLFGASAPSGILPVAVFINVLCATFILHCVFLGDAAPLTLGEDEIIEIG